MGKRDYKRIPVRLEAKFTLKATDYAGSLNKHSGFGINWHKFTGVIENLSEGGVYLRTSPEKNAIDFSPGTALDLEFQILTGKKFSLNCMVKWSSEIRPRAGIGNTAADPDLKDTAAGMEILKSSSKYKTFIKARLKQHRSYV